MIASTGFPRRVTATVAGFSPSSCGSFVNFRRASTVVSSFVSLVVVTLSLGYKTPLEVVIYNIYERKEG